MIGQERFKEKMKGLIEKGNLPRFMIIFGQKGQGKKTAAKWIAEQLGNDFQTYMLPDVKIDTVREMIDMCYTQKKPTFVIIPDVDTMSVAGKNALLKVAEEPPNNTYLLMTMEDLNNTLDTIRSRASIYYMDSYKPCELEEFFKQQVTKYSENQLDLITKLAINPGTVELLINSDVEKFYEYTEKVVDNIAKVSGANAFKIADKVAIKEDGDGYDLKMFFHMFNQVCLDRMLKGDENDKWAEGIQVTCDALNKLGIRGVNKQYIIDKWILEVRRAWM